MEKYYFKRPTQVRFVDPDYGEEKLDGIGYKDEVICMCCGGIFSVEELLEAAKENNIEEPIEVFKDWYSPFN